MPTQTLPIPTDAGAREALLERLQALAALRHPCVEAVAAVDVRDDGSLAVRRGGAMTDLPTVLAVRGRLTSQEAAGVLVGLARGLAALHSAGLSQGRLIAPDVVLDAAGGALLRPRAEPGAASGVEPGVMSGVISGADPGTADAEAADVHALAALVIDLLGDRTDDDATALRAVLAPAVAPDPRVRPEAGTLAAQADAAVEAEPVRLPEAASLAAASLGGRDGLPRGPVLGAVPTRTRARRAVRRRGGAPAGGLATRAARRVGARDPRPAGARRRLLALVGAAGVVAVLTAVALQVRLPAGTPSRSDEASPAAAPAGVATPDPTPDPTPDATPDSTPDPVSDRADPASAAAELTRRRVELLAGPGPDPTALDAVDLPGGPAEDADRSLLEEAARAGTQVRGAQARVEGATTRRHEGDEAEVLVRYVVGAHEQVAPDGTVTAVPETEPRSATLHLAWTPGGWRVAEVS